MTPANYTLTDEQKRRIWTAVATTPCGPLHADANWTPGEPCDNCADLADGIEAYLFATVERIVAEHVEAAERALVERVEAVLYQYNQLDDDDPTGWECAPEDRWRFGRDLRAALAPSSTENRADER